MSGKKMSKEQRNKMIVRVMCGVLVVAMFVTFIIAALAK